MLDSFTSSSASGLHSNNAALLTLRFHHENGQEEVVRVEDDKCTIGSGPRCTLRLRQAGVQPLHCLIIASEEGVAVRRWSAETWLNGQEFRDESLNDGDRLTVGPVDLDVLLGPSTGSESRKPTEINIEQYGRQFPQPVDASDPSDMEGAEDMGDPQVESDAENTTSGRQSPNLEPADAEVRDESNCVDPGETNVDPATEEVFRQLRAANEVSRARARRFLEALKEKRDLSRQLEARVDQLQQQLEQLVQEIDLQEATAVASSSGDTSVAVPEAEHDPPESDPDPESVPGMGEFSAAEPNRGDGELDTSESQFSARVADHRDEIANLEQELGDHKAAGDTEPARINTAGGTGPVAEVTSPVDHISARSAVEESASHSEVGKVDPPIRESGNAELDYAGADGSLTSEFASHLRREQNSDSKAVSREDSNNLDPTRIAKSTDSSTGATNFWKFGADETGVDQDLLGPKPLSHRAPANDDSLPENVETASADPQDLERLPKVTMAMTSSFKDELAGGMPKVPLLTSDLHEPPKLPPNEPPPLLGLSDSALAHLRDLSIWQDAPASNSDGREDDVAVADTAAGLPGQSREIPLPEDPRLESNGENTPFDASDRGYEQVDRGDESDVFDFRLPEPGQSLIDDPTESRAANIDLRGKPTDGELSATPAPEDSLPTIGDEEALEREVSPPDFPNSAASDELLVVEAPEADADLASRSSYLDLFAPKQSESCPNTSESASPESTSFIDRYAHMFEEGESTEPQSLDESKNDLTEGFGRIEPPAISPRLQAASGNVPPPDHSSESDEESLDEYMAKLMQRVRGESYTGLTSSVMQPAASEATVASPSVTPPAPSASEPAAVKEASSDDVTDAPSDEPLTLETFKSRGPLPEHNTDMQALRDLANHSARNAIGVHAARKQKKSLASRLMSAGIATISGVYLLITAPDLVSAQFFVGSIGALVAAYILGNAADSLLKVNKVSKDEVSTTKTADEKSDENPADVPAAADSQA